MRKLQQLASFQSETFKDINNFSEKRFDVLNLMAP